MLLVKWAAAEMAGGAMYNNGQSCCSVERIYVHADIYDEFVAELVAVVEAYKVGDPTVEENFITPLAQIGHGRHLQVKK